MALACVMTAVGVAPVAAAEAPATFVRLADPSDPAVDASSLVAIPAVGVHSATVAAFVHGLDPAADVSLPPDDGGPILVRTTSTAAVRLAGEIAESELFDAVDYDIRRTASDAGYTAAPDDPLFRDPTYGWGLKPAPGTALAAVWPTLDRATPGTEVPIAVIDSGFLASHVDMAPWVVPKWDYGESDPDIVPRGPQVSYHGSYVASVIGAMPNNGIGGTGAGWDTPVWCYKVTDSAGVMRDGVIAQAIDGAMRDGAKVINLSMGGPQYSAAMEAAIARAIAAGVVVVAAAGQSDGEPDTPANRTAMHYPASYPAVLSVAAIRPDGSAMPSGYYNDLVDIAAPGTEVGILIEGDSVGYGAGTSFAAPHAAAAAALLRRHRMDLDPAAIVAALVDAAR
ncbi:MAG: S8 family serine peptidase, partial [Bifidobacteriaceae bacterium]|nr:S8 family serine peptidase [Bifidobacteriaceae bacterium]